MQRKVYFDAAIAHDITNQPGRPSLKTLLPSGVGWPRGNNILGNVCSQLSPGRGAACEHEETYLASAFQRCSLKRKGAKARSSLHMRAHRLIGRVCAFDGWAKGHHVHAIAPFPNDATLEASMDRSHLGILAKNLCENLLDHLHQRQHFWKAMLESDSEAMDSWQSHMRSGVPQ